MNYRELYHRVYQYMDEKTIEEDCGKLCNSHCCRSYTEDGERIGIYLMPYEYESMLEGAGGAAKFQFEKHTSKQYFIPPKIKHLYYIHCDKSIGCFRELRPIQCRTYPFEPHLVGNKLSLVVEKEQIHQCPLLKRMDDLRKEFVKGIFEGWKLLLEIPEVKSLVVYDSVEREKSNNIQMIVDEKLLGE